MASFIDTFTNVYSNFDIINTTSKKIDILGETTEAEFKNMDI